MLELESSFVKQGYWNEVGRGPVLGKTITTDIRTGTIVISFLAVLVTLATSHIWNIVLFAVHQLRANGKAADLLSRQQQILLRASPSPASLLADWIRIFWVAKKKTRNTFIRSLGQSAFAFLFLVATIMAGIETSYAVESNNLHVLVTSIRCGSFSVSSMWDEANVIMTTAAGLRYEKKVLSRSTQHVQDCYLKPPTPNRCDIFTKHNDIFRSERTPCPFDHSLCISLDRPAVTIDSGLVNANDVFGWNLERQKEIKFRRRLACGILEPQGHRKFLNDSGRLRVTTHYSDDGHGEFSTYVDSNSSDGYLEEQVNTVQYYKNAKNRENRGPWVLVPGLQDNTSDVTLIGLSTNSPAFDFQINDPFFSAHKLLESGQYGYDNDISVLGCQQQYQFCLAQSTGSEICSTLEGLKDPFSEADFPGASPVQLAGVEVISTAALHWDISQLAYSTQLTNYIIDYGDKPDFVPDDQWVRQIIRWEQLVWAALQIVVSDYAIGYGIQENINVFALSFTITFAVVVTLIDLVLLKCLIHHKRPRKLLAPRLDRWIQDGVLQLQRRAYEADNQGDWTRLENEIPSTTGSEPLRELPLKTRRRCCHHDCGTHNDSSSSQEDLELESIKYA